MNTSSLPNFLVIRLDTATGFYKVGWDSDMPLGRFTHIEKICKTTSSAAITPNHPLYEQYQQACLTATQYNKKPLTTQHHQLFEKGWLPVPLSLHNLISSTQADEIGCFVQPATKLMQKLCQQHHEVWAVVHQQKIINVLSRTPPRVMQPVEFHVWKNH